MNRSFRALASALFALAAAATADAQFAYPVGARVSDTFYAKRSYGNHGGIDFAASQWTPIGASRAGRVSFSGWNTAGYGYLVILDHGSGYTTYYAHQVQTAVAAGQAVAVGQLVGYVGTTGNSTGPHLHFEVRKNAVPQYIPATIGQIVVKGAPIPYVFPGLDEPPPSSGPRALRVTASALNVRSGPGSGYAIKGSVAAGQYWISSTSSSGWHKIWYDGTEGWVSGSYVATASGVSAVKATSASLNVRTGPGTGYSIAGYVYSGHIHAWTALSSGWYRIYWGGGLYYVSGGYVQAGTY